jgi:DNA (cytosine-5)-methyltransferase 1
MEALNELALFAGAGGGILGGTLLGWRTVCAVENAPYPRRVLLARQRDGILPRFPIWDDVCTFDGKPWRGRVDVVSGGFPCQDISAAGKGAGITGSRSGLWGEMARIIGEVRPRFVFVENSPLLVSRGLTTVLGDLAAMGFYARWGVLGAHHLGYPHKRERIWIYANSNENDDAGSGRPTGGRADPSIQKWVHSKDGKEWESWLCNLATMDVVQRADSYSEGRRVFYGMADGMDRIAAIGNGQVPAVAALAWTLLSGHQ